MTSPHPSSRSTGIYLKINLSLSSHILSKNCVDDLQAYHQPHAAVARKSKSQNKPGSLISTCLPP